MEICDAFRRQLSGMNVIARHSANGQYFFFQV